MHLNRLSIFVAVIAVNSWAQEIIAPHLTRTGGGFQSNVLIQNHNQNEITIQLQPYRRHLRCG